MISPSKRGNTKIKRMETQELSENSSNKKAGKSDEFIRMIFSGKNYLIKLLMITTMEIIANMKTIRSYKLYGTD